MHGFDLRPTNLRFGWCYMVILVPNLQFAGPTWVRSSCWTWGNSKKKYVKNELSWRQHVALLKNYKFNKIKHHYTISAWICMQFFVELVFGTIDSYRAPTLLATKVNTQMVKARLDFKELLIYQVARALAQSMFPTTFKLWWFCSGSISQSYYIDPIVPFAK